MNTGYPNYNIPNPQYAENPQIIQNAPIMPPAYGQVVYQPPVQSPMIQGAAMPLLSAQNSNLSLRAIECFDDLNEASEAILTKYFDGLIFRDTMYNVSIKYKSGGMDRTLFVGKKTSSKFFNNVNVFKVNVKYIPRDCNLSDALKDKKFDIRFFDVSTAAGFMKTVQVLNIESNTLFGEIAQPSTCCCADPDFQIKNSSNIIKYRVVTNGCQCGYCCCDGCCCLNSPVDYSILDNTHTHILGNILKCRFYNAHKEKLTYRIIFPLDATPEEKLLLISTAISIDNYVYRSIG